MQNLVQFHTQFWVKSTNTFSHTSTTSACDPINDSLRKLPREAVSLLESSLHASYANIYSNQASEDVDLAAKRVFLAHTASDNTIYSNNSNKFIAKARKICDEMVSK